MKVRHGRIRIIRLNKKNSKTMLLLAALKSIDYEKTRSDNQDTDAGLREKEENTSHSPIEVMFYHPPAKRKTKLQPTLTMDFSS